jgi:hypothetical protein
LSFFNIYYDGAGLIGNPLTLNIGIFGGFLTVLLLYKEKYSRIFVSICMAELLLAYCLFQSQPPKILIMYTNWIIQYVPALGKDKLPIDVKVYLTIIMWLYPIKLYLFTKWVQIGDNIRKTFIISPLNRYKTRAMKDLFRQDIDYKSERENTEEKHSYFKMVFYWIILTVTIIIFGTSLLIWEKFFQPIEQGGMAMWLQCSLIIPTLTALFGAVWYLTTKDWIKFILKK